MYESRKIDPKVKCKNIKGIYTLELFQKYWSAMFKT